MRSLLYKSVWLLFLSGIVSAAHADSDPKAMLESVANKMITFIDSNKQKLSDDENFAKSLVRSELLPYIDQQGLGRRVIVTKVWQDLTASEQQRFIDGFVSLVIDTYASGLSKYDGEQFVFEETTYHNSAKTAYVRSKMASIKDDDVEIHYTLKKPKESNEWRIVDVKIEGVSMVQTYRSQFRSLIKSEGFNAVLAKLENKKLKISLEKN